MYTYVYIYIYRERERERDTYIEMHIYIYIYTERERYRRSEYPDQDQDGGPKPSEHVQPLIYLLLILPDVYYWFTCFVFMFMCFECAAFDCHGRPTPQQTTHTRNLLGWLRLGWLEIA